jgi:hypothetical protein
MPPKAKLPAPIDRPLSRAYLREFTGWSTEYPPGISEPTSLRIMENVQINRDGSCRVRPGMRYLSYDVPPVTTSPAVPLEGLILRGVVEYNGQADAPLPVGSQVGDLVVVQTTRGNVGGGNLGAYPHGDTPDPRLTGYEVNIGSEHYWGTLTDLDPLTLASYDVGVYGSGGGYPGSAKVRIAVYGDASGQDLTANVIAHAERAESLGNVMETLSIPACDGPVVLLQTDARGYGYSTHVIPPFGYGNPANPVLPMGYYLSLGFPGGEWAQGSDYQIYDQVVTALEVRPVASAAVDVPGVAFDRPFVGTHEAFYLNDGTKAYLCAVREEDLTVGFRVLVLSENGSTMYALDDPVVDFTLSSSAAVLNFSEGTTYVKYLQVDNKIFALSNNGENMRMFSVGEFKEAKTLSAITRPEWENEDKLDVFQPDSAWVSGGEPIAKRRNKVPNPSFEQNFNGWWASEMAVVDRPAVPPVTPVSGGRVLSVTSAPVRKNLVGFALTDVATSGTMGWSEGVGDPAVSADGSWMRLQLDAEKRRFLARSRLYPGVDGQEKYKLAYQFDAGNHVSNLAIVRFYGVNGAQVGQDVEITDNTGIVGAGGIRIVSPAMQAPKNAVSFRLFLGGENLQRDASNVRFKDVMFCKAGENTNIFTGDDGANYFWEGDPLASAAVYHPPQDLTIRTALIPVNANKAHVSSIHVRAGSTVRSIDFELVMLDKDGQSLSVSDSLGGDDSAADWTRYSATNLDNGPNAAQARLRVMIPNVARGEYHYLDAAMLEPGGTLGDYFDGSVNDATLFRREWMGDPHNSISLEEELAATLVLPTPETKTAATLMATGGKEANPYSFGFFYTFENEVGESAASQVSIVRTSRAWTEWLWETATIDGEPSGTPTLDPALAADQLVAVMPQDVWNSARAQGAVSWSLYVFTWSDQEPVPVTASKVGERELAADSVYEGTGWLRITPALSEMSEDALIPAEVNLWNYSDPSRGGQGIVASDRMVMVYDPTAAAVIRWSSNQMGEYTNFTAGKGGGFKTLTSGNLFVPAVVKLWQNPQSADTLWIGCLGTDGYSASYYMAPAQVASQSAAVNVMGFEETTATPGTTSPYGVEVFNNTLFHPLEDQLMKSTASNYNINHKSMTDTIRNMWIALQEKQSIISSQHDGILYYIVTNPYGEQVEEGCNGNELWVFDATAKTGTWSRYLIQGHSLRKLEFGGKIYMSVIRPDGVYYLDPEYGYDDVVGEDLVVLPTPISWRLETNTQGANRAHDAWAHLQQLEIVLGRWQGAMSYGVRGVDLNGKLVDKSKIVRDNAAPDTLHWDISDFLRVARDMREWNFYASSVDGEPSFGQINLVQYRYTPVSVNVGYEQGSIETFEYGRDAAGVVTATTDNGIPLPHLDSRRP